jgi:hypothetical protein
MLSVISLAAAVAAVAAAPIVAPIDIAAAAPAYAAA